MSHFIYCYAECHYAECLSAECRYAECRYVECRGAIWSALVKMNDIFVLQVVTSSKATSTEYQCGKTFFSSAMTFCGLYFQYILMIISDDHN